MATLLAKGVKFQLLIDQLSKQEFLQFMGKIFDLNKTHIIKTSLFNHLTTSSFDKQLNDINSMLSNIIQSRKTKPKPMPTTNIKLDQLPNSLIGHTASFLTQNDYVSFQKANRCIFISCNAPNTLKKLNLCNIKNYSSINLSRFRSLKQFEINITKFNELILPKNGQIIMNELQEIVFTANNENDVDVEPFINQNCINITNVKTLCFRNFGVEARNSDDLQRLLSKFANIEYLELFGTATNIDAAKLKQIYPDLKGLTVAGGDNQENNEYINIFGNNLQFLGHMFPRSNMDFSKVNFSKLQQLMLVTPTIKTIDDILKTAQNVQKIFLRPTQWGIVSPSKQELKGVIAGILECKSLEYLGVAVNDETCSLILDGIEAGLYKTKKWKRKQLKIRIYTLQESHIDVNNEMILNVGRIIRWMESANIMDFMFIWDLTKMDKTIRNKIDGDKILNELKDISSNINVIAHELRFVISNKNCHINGWNESWLIKK